MDSFLLEMMKADINKYKFELIMSAKKILNRLEKKGYLSKAVNMAKTVQMHKDTMEFKAKEIIDEIDNIIRFEAVMTDDTSATLSIWINPDFFLNTDVIKNSIGKRTSKILKIMTRQKMVDGFESAIRDDYTRDFSGTILESDGDSFVVKQ